MKPYLDNLTKRSWFRVLTKLGRTLRPARCASSAQTSASEAAFPQFDRKGSQLSIVGTPLWARSQYATKCNGISSSYV
jgi:hypothetical protein